MSVKNVLPDWYPAIRHVERLPLPEWVGLFRDLAARADVLELSEAFDSKPLDGRLSVVSTLDRWRPLKVLDFLDLYLWAHEEDVFLSGDFIAETLFPFSEAVNIRSRLLVSTRPLAFSLISPFSISVLDELLSEQAGSAGILI